MFNNTKKSVIFFYKTIIKPNIKLIACLILLITIVCFVICLKLNINDNVNLTSGNLQLKSNSTGVGNEITISFVGDIMCHDGQILDAKQEDGTYNFDNCFTDIKDLTSKADITIGNLEGILVENDQDVYGYPDFYMPTSFADSLANIGFDILSINNLQCDNNGDEGINYTKEYLEKIGVNCIGANSINTYPAICEIDGIKIAIITIMDQSYIDSENQGAEQYLNLINRDQIKADIDYCESKNVDFIVAYMRWGEESNNVPTDEMKSTAKFVTSLGVDVIVGGGSHVMMPMDVFDCDSYDEIGNINKGYSFYGIGNFISNQRNNAGDMGAMLTLTIRKISSKTTRLTQFNITPIYTNVDIDEGHNFKVVPVYESSQPPEWMDEYNAERYNKTYGLITSIFNPNIFYRS